MHHEAIREEAGIMKYMSKILTFCLILVVIICEIHLMISENDNLLIRSGVVSDSGQTQSFFSTSDTETVEYCTPELIGIHDLNTLSNNRLLANSIRTRVSFGSVLSALIAVVCLFVIAFRRFKCGYIPRRETWFSSVILYFIHEKDGKK